MTKQEMVERMDIDDSFDYALPQKWVDKTQGIVNGSSLPSVNVVQHFIWLYDLEGGISGRPFPLTMTGEKILNFLGD